jgi:O-antigen/teichoic acid export membrane protein
MLAQHTDEFNLPAAGMWSGLFRGSAVILAADLLMVPTGLLTVALLTRWLGPEGYGIFALSASLVAAIEWTLASVLSRPTIHSVGHATDWRPIARTLLGWHLTLATAVLIILWITARPLAGLLGESELDMYLILFACDLPFFLLAQAYRNILTGRGRFAARALTGASRWVARLALTAIAVRLGLSIPAAIVASVGASIIELAIGRWALGAVGSVGTADTEQLKRLVLPLVVSAAGMAVLGKMDLFLIKTLGMPIGEAGLYAAAQNLAVLPGIFGQAVSAVVLSELTRTRLIGHSTLFERTAEGSLHACLYLVPVTGLVAGAAPGIVVLCFGSAFEAAGPVVSLLMVGAVAQVFIGMLMAILTAGGHVRWTMGLVSPLVVIALGGHLYAIPVWGPLGAAWTTSIVLILGASAGYVAIHHLFAIRLQFNCLARALLLGGLAWAIGIAGPGGAAWLLLGLPAIAIVLTILYGRLEGVMNAGSLLSAARLGGRRAGEVR